MSAGNSVNFNGRVAIITGAGNGLGRAYALLLGSRGAKVVVNDLGGAVDGSGASSKAADVVVAEIQALGGDAIPSYDSCTDGGAIVDAALAKWGRVDILINNAGILRDSSFQKMTDAQWNAVMAVHLQGTFAVTRAAWPHMCAAGYGRVVMVTSSTGLYGNFGQANYGAAKMGILGLARALAVEGARKGVLVNTVSPIAASRMTADVMPPDLLAALAPEAVAPLVAYLASEACTSTGAVLEAGAGWVAPVRWQRAKGVSLPPQHSLEQLAAAWGQVTDFDAAGATHPSSTQSAFEPIMANIEAHRGGLPQHEGGGLESMGAAASGGSSGAKGPAVALPPLQGGRTGCSDAVDVAAVLSARMEAVRASHSDRDTILYALSVGASADPLETADLQYTYELGEGGLQVLPTFAVLWPHASNEGLLSLPGLSFNPMMLLHGEQETVWGEGGIPPAASTVTTPRIGAVYDKGSGAVLVVDAATREAGKGGVLALNRSRVFIRGIGGFGGDRGPSAPAWDGGKGAPALQVGVPLPRNSALLYRLNGDRNPLHADPQMAAMGGFDKPILHGLCTYGVAGYVLVKHVLQGEGGGLKRMAARFSKHVYPGENLLVRVWKSRVAPLDPRATHVVAFDVTVPERNNVVVLTGGIAELSVRPHLSTGAAASAAGGDAKL